jgi:hypothetical protein
MCVLCIQQSVDPRSHTNVEVPWRLDQDCHYTAYSMKKFNVNYIGEATCDILIDLEGWWNQNIWCTSDVSLGTLNALRFTKN